MKSSDGQQPCLGGVANQIVPAGLRRRGLLKGAAVIAASVLGSFTARAQTPAAEAPKKKAYTIVDVQIRDKDVFYKEYVPGHSPTITKFGGRFLWQHQKSRSSKAIGLPTMSWWSTNGRTWSIFAPGTNRQTMRRGRNCGIAFRPPT